MEIPLDTVALLPLFRSIEIDHEKPTLVFHFLANDEELCKHLRELVQLKKGGATMNILAITPDHFAELVPQFGLVEDLCILDIARDLFDELSFLHERYYHKIDLFPHCYVVGEKMKVIAEGSLLEPEFARELSSFKHLEQINQT